MSWKEFISSEMEKDYFKSISKTLSEESKTHEIYPSKKDIFAAYDSCPIDKIKAVIVGQDCYFNPGQAHGLSFSVPKDKTIPPSLRNIYKELHNDLNIIPPNHGCLTSWAEQGVFLLNSILTVRRGIAGSHGKIGWQKFTDNTIKLINGLDRPIVYLLWGAFARNKKALITNKMHCVLEAGHPSPLNTTGNFTGCKHFSKANEFLVKNGVEPIDWSIE